MLTKAPRGTYDILPERAKLWQYIENKARNICVRFGYGEIRTPVFEHTELFERGVGDTTDVVQKEMYTFTDKGDRSITLRPEGTAGAIRAYIENNLYAQPLPAKLFYLISCYRYEKPQAGRLREFHQFGVECVGAENPSLDVEIILLARQMLIECGVKDFTLYLNSIGCPTCRKTYNEALYAYAKEREDGLCETCRGRLERNPMRILDCKSPVCQELMKDAPRITDYLCEDCSAHFDGVKGALNSLDVPFEIDPDIVRGLDYYTKTVFEFKTELDGMQGTVSGGGRYDGLVEELGGAPTPAIGFAMGIERLILAMEKAGSIPEFETGADIFVASLGSDTDVPVTKLVAELRGAGVAAERDHMGRSVKAQMKYADKLGAKFTAVIGADEIASGKVKVKNMQTGESGEVELTAAAIAQYIK